MYYSTFTGPLCHLVLNLCARIHRWKFRIGFSPELHVPCPSPIDFRSVGAVCSVPPGHRHLSNHDGASGGESKSNNWNGRIEALYDKDSVDNL